MSEQFKPQFSKRVARAPHRKRKSTCRKQKHPKSDYYFDAALHIVRRSKELAWESKEFVVALLILILLVQHSFHVLTK